MDFLGIMQSLLNGLGNTVLLFGITLVFAVPLGLLLALGATSRFKPLKWIIKSLVWVIRSTPLILQILFISCVPAYLLMIDTTDLAAKLNISVSSVTFILLCIAFVINYAFYFSEIFRGGIESIPKGQYEAGQVLGMTKGQVFRHVVLMQVVKRIVPPMSNEIITLVKDTSLARVLNLVDLLTAAQDSVNALGVLTPYLYAAIFYLVFNGLLTLLFNFIEKKLSYYKV